MNTEAEKIVKKILELQALAEELGAQVDRDKDRRIVAADAFTAARTDETRVAWRALDMPLRKYRELEGDMDKLRANLYVVLGIRMWVTR